MVRQEKEIKGLLEHKERKLPLFVDGMIVYAENFKEFTRKFLKLVSLTRLQGLWAM